MWKPPYQEILWRKSGNYKNYLYLKNGKMNKLSPWGAYKPCGSVVKLTNGPLLSLKVNKQINHRNQSVWKKWKTIYLKSYKSISVKTYIAMCRYHESMKSYA